MQPVTSPKTALQKQVGLSLLPSDSFQHLWSASTKSLHSFDATADRQGLIPTFPNKIKQNDIEERHVVNEKKLHACNLHCKQYAILVTTISQAEADKKF